MNKTIMRCLFLGFFGVWGSPATANELVVSMECKVKYQIVVLSENGITKTFSGLTNKFEIGDTLSVIVEFDTTEKNLFFYVGDDDHSIFAYRTRSLRSLDHSSRLLDLNKDYYFTMDENMISSRGSYGSINFKRYYKSDYEAIFIRLPYVTNHNFMSHLVTLDCRTTKNELDEIFETFVD